MNFGLLKNITAKYSHKNLICMNRICQRITLKIDIG